MTALVLVALVLSFVFGFAVGHLTARRLPPLPTYENGVMHSVPPSSVDLDDMVARAKRHRREVVDRAAARS